jgi:rubrerythrin
MQPNTELGINRSGMAVAPDAGEKMLENTELTKPSGNEEALVELRLAYAEDAEPVGSPPDPALTGAQALLMDKLGERLAFERSGTRLYDALAVKCRADGESGVDAEEIAHIRNEEAEHFALCGAAIQSLGGDPTSQTPSADVTGVEGMGLMQVLSDPKTTVAQGLHAILIAELADNAAWEELIELTQEAGNEDLVARFTKASEQEAEHLEKVRAWYKAAARSTVSG